MIAGKHLHPNEADLLDEVAIQQAANKLERVATYREIQALSAMVQGLSGGDLDDYSTSPEAFLIRPVKDDITISATTMCAC